MVHVISFKFKQLILMIHIFLTKKLEKCTEMCFVFVQKAPEQCA